MQAYVSCVFRPYQIAKATNLVARTTQGQIPEPSDRLGLGPYFSKTNPKPVFLQGPNEHALLVEKFHRMGETCDGYVQAYSASLMDEAIEELKHYIRPDYRLLDAGCGAGRGVCRMARLVPRGEVVGIDLAAGMINAAYRGARAKGLDNTAFYQADIGNLPDELTAGFDLVYSSLAHHHYPDPLAASHEIFRVLRPGGYYAVIDAGPRWFIERSAPLARWADPGWVGFHTPDQFMTLFCAAGFESAGWIDLLPGFGIACARKPL
jgi:ubiquinone/menaquinone biosynthesis C-methylase UbiE